jgi:hypothetical protein
VLDRLPREVIDARIKRLKLEMDLSMKNQRFSRFVPQFISPDALI